MRAARVVIVGVVLAVLSSVLGGHAARADVTTASSVQWAQYRNKTLTLPTVTNGTFHRFTVTDPSGRIVPLDLIPSDPRTSAYVNGSIYSSRAGLHTFQACLDGICVTVKQSSTGAALATLPSSGYRLSLSPIRARVGQRATVVAQGFDLTKGKLYYQWIRDFEPIVGASGASYTITAADHRRLIEVRISYVVAGKAVYTTDLIEFVGTNPYDLGDFSGDGVADFFVFGPPAADGTTKVQAWAGSRTGRASLKAVHQWSYGPVGAANVTRGELYCIAPDGSLEFGEVLGNGVMEGWGAYPTALAGHDTLLSLNVRDKASPTEGLTSYLLARRTSDGALMRYSPDGKGGLSGAKVGNNWKGMKFIVSPGDVTGDGVPDVLGVKKDGTLWQYQLRSDGVSVATKQVGHGWQGFTQLFSPGDVTGDNRSDLIGLRSDGTVVVYANQLGSWGKPRVLITGLTNVKLMA